MTHYVHSSLDSKSLFLYDPEYIAQQIILSVDTEIVFLSGLWESSTRPDQWIKTVSAIIQSINKQRPNVKVFLLLNTWWQSFNLTAIPATDILYIDFFAYRVYKEIAINGNAGTAYRWPQNKNKFLFLTGNPKKLQRIRLLSKLVDAGIIDRAEWSLHKPSNTDDLMQARIQRYVPEMTTAEFQNFLDAYARNPDNIDATCYSNNRGYTGIPYDVRLYSETSFSIVPETNFNTTKYPWITEKIWKSIINFHPFIVAGDTNTLDLLKRMGFATYEKFLPFPNYDTIENPEQRLNAIVKNASYWLDYLDPAIQERTEFNWWRFQELYRENLNRINQFINFHSLCLTADELISTNFREPMAVEDINESSSEWLNNQKFCKFYSAIKDSTWPECTSENDFKNLPEHIQQECINLFGYVPRPC